MKKYYLVEISYGDDNDNHKADMIVVAENMSACLDLCEKHFDRTYKTSDTDGMCRDGDEQSVTHLWYDSNDIPQHVDYRVESEHDTKTEANAEKSRYHSDWGEYGDE